jgi:hypothetical protein
MSATVAEHIRNAARVRGDGGCAPAGGRTACPPQLHSPAARSLQARAASSCLASGRSSSVASMSGLSDASKSPASARLYAAFSSRCAGTASRSFAVSSDRDSLCWTFRVWRLLETEEAVSEIRESDLALSARSRESESESRCN